MRTIVNRLSQSDSAEAWKQVTYFFNNCFIYDLKRVCCLQTIIMLSSTNRNNPKSFHFKLISALAYYTNLLGLCQKRIFQSVKPPFQTLAKFFIVKRKTNIRFQHSGNTLDFFELFLGRDICKRQAFFFVNIKKKIISTLRRQFLRIGNEHHISFYMREKKNICPFFFCRQLDGVALRQKR